ncbi:uncharacterized protein LOC100856432 [Canis lupus familiaris]|uniref:uncharacterized protein LOC100856432 n=1 Tax=Canis lupus familiaris TaxID=9615 RepID=UPI0018F57385|nr:uncharacterized protein LOC100856432 [Canis lupus familiaris]XP_038319795.1 uncharacterized protein LOC100856432 [Canis lupus familiaris]
MVPARPPPRPARCSPPLLPCRGLRAPAGSRGRGRRRRSRDAPGAAPPPRSRTPSPTSGGSGAARGAEGSGDTGAGGLACPAPPGSPASKARREAPPPPRPRPAPSRRGSTRGGKALRRVLLEFSAGACGAGAPLPLTDLAYGPFLACFQSPWQVSLQPKVLSVRRLFKRTARGTLLSRGTCVRSALRSDQTKKLRFRQVNCDIRSRTFQLRVSDSKAYAAIDCRPQVKPSREGLENHQKVQCKELARQGRRITGPQRVLQWTLMRVSFCFLLFQTRNRPRKA